MLWIQVLVAEHQKQHLREAKLSAADVFLNVALHLLNISLVGQLNPVWLLDFDTELLASFSKTVKDVVSRVVVTPSIGVFGTNLVSNDPLLKA